jgi:hypothetical protein
MNPLAVALWIALSSAMIQLLGWWPDADQGLLGYARPLPAFAATLVPIIAAVDWYVPRAHKTTHLPLTPNAGSSARSLKS